MEVDEKIDFVIMWVDGNDPEWQKEKAKYDVKTNADGTIYRYRDWNLLQYWFRGVEKFAPWVNNIYFITWGHLPEWLNTENPKLKIINHKDYIPEKYLPTFSANTIENNIYRIKDLSENFVLFNDDVYLINKTKIEDFFEKGVPKDTVALNVHCPKKSLISQYFCINDTGIINEHFDFKKSFNENKKKWFSLKNGVAMLRTLALMKCPRFPGFWQHHLSSSLSKSTFEEVWNKEFEILDNTCKHKFRETTDVNQWVFKEWQIAAGNFEIRNSKFGKSFFIDRDGIEDVKPKALRYIRNQKGKIITINDGEMSEEEFENTLKQLSDAFESILPEKSSFEK